MTDFGIPNTKNIRPPNPNRNYDWNGRSIRYNRNRDNQIAQIPICPSCGDRCTVCHSLNKGQAWADAPAGCCLILAQREKD